MEELAAAEKRMNSIESRLLSVESIGVSSNSDGVQEALSEYQSQILEKLKGIRSSIVEEGGDIAKIKEERDTAVTENAKLKKDIDKLNYRIQHLVKALNAEESKH
jgi:hypothetical protein